MEQGLRRESMSKQYRIEWTSQNGKSGHGEWVDGNQLNNKDSLRVWANYANSKYPEIKHTVVERE
jgi:hypothetical protein